MRKMMQWYVVPFVLEYLFQADCSPGWLLVVHDVNLPGMFIRSSTDWKKLYGSIWYKHWKPYMKEHVLQ